MARFWSIDSPFMKKMTTLSNLIILNILWLLCSVPVITVGASTAAMYHVLFLYHKKETDSVIKPFFHAFRSSIKQATVLWLLLMILYVALGIDALYLLSNATGTQLLLWIPFGIIAALAIITASFGFAQIAMFRNTLPSIIRSGLNLFLLNLIPSLAIVLIHLLPVIMLVFLPKLFMASLIIWSLLGFSLSAYLSSYLLMKIFRKYTSDAI